MNEERLAELQHKYESQAAAFSDLASFIRTQPPAFQAITESRQQAAQDVLLLIVELRRLRAALEPLLRHFEVRMMQYGRASQGQRYVSPNHFYFPGIAQIDAAHEALNHTPNASQLPVQLSGPDEHAFDGQD